jgi:hypothetical protein
LVNGGTLGLTIEVNAEVGYLFFDARHSHTRDQQPDRIE